jgi:protein adenylyltransferase
LRPFDFDNSFARELTELGVEWQADAAPSPSLVAFNTEMADELGADPAALQSPEGVAVLAGSSLPQGAAPIAMAYGGHQFGGYSPSLGDGRALLLGEIIDPNGCRRDLHLKGSGRTPFARGGDGKAALGPMLREFLIAEAMHALRIPTTRALAVVFTGEQVARESVEPGAVLARVAASHIRVGTFEYAARLPDPSVLTRLADHAIARHHPAAGKADQPYLAFLEAVVDAQAQLIADWMLVGFIHGVMNTDNMTISGEGIDYGPCAFMDSYDPATVFSSIDQGGRYAYGNQPAVAQWNLTRLGETLLTLIDPDVEVAVASATEVLDAFSTRFGSHWSEGMRAKLGLALEAPDDAALFDDLLERLHSERVDYTKSFRGLAGVLRGDEGPLRSLFEDQAALDAWISRWQARLAAEDGDPVSVAAGMDEVNPLYIPRNHLVDEALDSATAGDLGPFEELLGAVAWPFDERPGLERFTEPAGEAFNQGFKTYCGT